MQPGRGWRRWTPTIGKALAPAALAVVLATTGTAHAAKPPVTIENVRVGFQQDRYRPGSWNPIRVDVKAESARFGGILEVVVADDDGTPTAIRREFLGTPGEMTSVTTYVRPGRRDNDFKVNVYDAASGGLAASATYSKAEALQRGQSLLLTVGRASGVDIVPGTAVIDPQSENTNVNPYGAQVVVLPVAVPQGIPAKWYGYDAAGVVVLNANSQEALDALDAGRGEALKEWVRNGGHLVVAIGERWQPVLGSVLEPLLPALPAGRDRLNDLGALESFAGPNSRPIVPVGEKAMLVTKLEPVEARGAQALDTSGLIVRGFYGFGRVTVVGLDVDQKPFSDWPDRKDFWVKVLDLRRRAGEAENTTPGLPGGGGFYQNGGLDVAGALHQSMEQFPGVRLVPFGYVAFFVFLYILLIGPGDYFFLKKVLRRMELTWVTFPLIVVTVSALAYAAAYAVKGTELKVNKVDALDIDQATGRMRGTTWFTVFSPQNRDYDLSIAPLPLDRDPSASDAVSAGTSAGGGESMVSWFGAPEGAFGGGPGGPGGLTLSAGSYAYVPIGDPRTLKGVRVPIWTTKSFTGRWTGAAKAVVDADLQQAGPDRLGGSITNRLPRALRRARLLHGRKVYDLGDLNPGQTRPIGDDNTHDLAGQVDSVLGRLNMTNPYQQFQAQPVGTSTLASRDDIVFAAMFRDAAGSSFAHVDNLSLNYLDLTGLLALDRPMLVAEVDGPVAGLDLGKVSGAPKVTQSTLIRVVLPAIK